MSKSMCYLGVPSNIYSAKELNQVFGGLLLKYKMICMLLVHHNTPVFYRNY